MKQRIRLFLSLVVVFSVVAMLVVATLPHTHLHEGQTPLSGGHGESCFLCHVQANFSIDRPVQHLHLVQSFLLQKKIVIPIESPQGIFCSYLPSQRAPPALL